MNPAIYFCKRGFVESISSVLKGVLVDRRYSRYYGRGQVSYVERTIRGRKRVRRFIIQGDFIAEPLDRVHTAYQEIRKEKDSILVGLLRGKSVPEVLKDCKRNVLVYDYK